MGVRALVLVPLATRAAAARAGMRRWRATFGGAVHFVAGRTFTARQAPAPAGCP